MPQKIRIKVVLLLVLTGLISGLLTVRTLAVGSGSTSINRAGVGVTSSTTPGAVLINEVVTDPQQDWSGSGFTDPPETGPINYVDEWVELSITIAGLDLTGWTIELLDGTDVTGDLTSSGAFQVSNYVSSGGGSFNNTAEGDYLVLGNVAGSGRMNNDILIILKDDTGAVVDKVEIGDDPEGDGDGDGAPDGSGSDGNATNIDDEAIARVPNATDTDNDVNDFLQQAATIGVSNGPSTAITLAAFEIEVDTGAATIIWETGTEIDNAGFNLYRAASPDGPWTQINSTLIPAEGNALTGARYTFTDRPGRGTFYYRLEDIDYNGLSTLHEPKMADLGPTIRTPWFRPVLRWLGL